MSQDPKQRIFIYDRREVAVLVLLGLMVAVFAFTLGVHLGKKVGEGGPAIASNEKGKQVITADTIDDTVPTRLEMSEQSKGVDVAIDESLNQVLHDEVARTGVKLQKKTQTKLPSKPASRNQGATTGPRKEEMASTQVKKAIVVNQPTPQGKYTIQIGSFPDAKEALTRLEKLESVGQRTFIREAKVKGNQWYRVYVGGFRSKKEADQIAKKFVSQNIINNYIVANMPQ